MRGYRICGIVFVIMSGCTLRTEPLAGIDAGGDVADLQARIAALEAAEDCPRVVLRDGTRRSYLVDRSTAGVTRCSAGMDEMVRVGDFWVDRYEGSVCCSRAGVTPSRQLSWFQAAQACALAGKHLCSNQEWQIAAAGTNDPGAFDGLTGSACNTSGAMTRRTGAGGGDPGGTASCVSMWGSEDAIGNAEEWVTWWQGEAGKSGSSTFWPATPYHDDAYIHGGVEPSPGYLTSGSTLVRSGPGATDRLRLPAAAIRGGYAGAGTQAGAFRTVLDNAPTVTDVNIGFRCCYSR